MLSVDAIDEIQERIRQAPQALISARIRRARRECRFSHDKLAAAMNAIDTRPDGGRAARQHLIKLEQEKHRPRAELLQLIADATERDIDYFLDSEAVENPFPNEA